MISMVGPAARHGRSSPPPQQRRQVTLRRLQQDVEAWVATSQDDELPRSRVHTGGGRIELVDDEGSRSRPPTFEEWWTRTSALAGPLAMILAALSEDVLQAIHAHYLRTAVAFCRTPNGLVLPCVTLLAS